MPFRIVSSSDSSASESDGDTSDDSGPVEDRDQFIDFHYLFF